MSRLRRRPRHAAATLVTFVVLIALTATPAIAGPPMSTLVAALKVSFEECRQRVQQTLTAEALGGWRDYGNGWIATDSTRTVALACIRGDGETVVHVAVATNGEAPESTRDRLWERMQGKQPGGLQGEHLSVELQGTTARVRWRGTPGNQTDWVSVVRLPAGDDTYGSNWTYTAGKRDGELTAAGLAPGEYEVRLYHDWPTGQYNVRERLRFTVP